MGVHQFREAVRTEAVENAKAIHTTRGFGILDDRYRKDVETWRALHDATSRAVDLLRPESTHRAWKQTAFAFATCFARTPQTLSEKLDAIELRDALSAKLDQSPYKGEITAYLTRIIPEYQVAQTPEHIAAYEQAM